MSEFADSNLNQLAQHTGQLLQANNQMLTTAESCTGGWIAKVLTDCAGSSVWFERGFVTYSNAAKQEQLGVPEHILIDYGAVSAATVTAMAEGALRHSNAHYSVAVSGIAGPGGGSVDKPVGTVWIGWANQQHSWSQHFLFPGDREAIRRATVAAALQDIISALGGQLGS